MALHHPVFALLRALPPFRGKGRIGRILAKRLIDRSDVEGALRPFKMRDGTTMRSDVRSYTSEFAYWTGEYDDTIRRLLRFVTPGSTVLDIGAHVGFYTVPLARHVQASGGQVYAFEPMPGNFEFLLQNIAANQLETVVHPVQAALSEREASLEMRNSEPGAKTGNAVVVNTQNRLAPTHIARGLTLDSFAAQHGINNCSLIKADIEGAELFMLRGALEFIARHRPVIYGEFNRNWMRRLGCSFPEVWQLMAPLEYGFWQFNGNHWIELQEPQIGLENLLLIPREKPKPAKNQPST